MIKGQKRKDYNDFEEEIVFIVGDIAEKSGLDFFFEHIYQTFDIAEKAINKHSPEYRDWFDSQDYETRHSIYFYDVEHEISCKPLTEMLHKSHFITVHSEFESIWKEIIKIHNKYFTPRNFASLSYEFLKPQNFNPTCLLDRVVNNHKILLSYNYVRNKIVHQNAVKTSSEYLSLMTYLTSQDIKYLKVSIDGTKAYFEIEDIRFNVV
jgi:hypothetical protein